MKHSQTFFFSGDGLRAIVYITHTFKELNIIIYKVMKLYLSNIFMYMFQIFEILNNVSKCWPNYYTLNRVAFNLT